MKSLLTVALLTIIISISNAQNVLSIKFKADAAAGKKLVKQTSDEEIQSFNPKEVIKIMVDSLLNGQNALVNALFNNVNKAVEGGLRQSLLFRHFQMPILPVTRLIILS